MGTQGLCWGYVPRQRLGRGIGITGKLWAVTPRAPEQGPNETHIDAEEESEEGRNTGTDGPDDPGR